ncbi:MAG: dehydrogenase [Mycobacterium sp.]|nr:dehydrogenase [Mycobacterium sp.]
MAEQSLVVNISLSDPGRDYDESVEFLGRSFRIVRVGTGGSVRGAIEELHKWSGAAAAIGVSGVHDALVSGTCKGNPGKLRRAAEKSAGAVVTDGHRLRTVLQEWTIRHLTGEMPGYFANARVVVLGGPNHYRTTRVLSESTQNMFFADPAVEYGLADIRTPFELFERAVSASGWLLEKLPSLVVSTATGPARKIIESRVRKALRDCDVVVATFRELARFELDDLKGKTLISTSIGSERLNSLRERGVDLILDDVPQPFDQVVVNEATLEALMLVAGEAEESRLSDDDLLEMIQSAQLQPRILYPSGFKRRSRFAFVIHPLSQEYFRNVKPLDAVAEVAPGIFMDGVEKLMAHAPPFVYSHVTGITSPTGAEVEGWLITVGGTPKELMAHDPEFTYSRLLAAADMAKKMGAQIMGLGAFTKVVGDAGVTVAKRAPLPITTGNSYSASGALWAAHDAVRRLGIADVDAKGHIKGKAMVVGATGAIGSVCARLLAMAADELWLVSIEPAKLLALKADIERDNPRAAIHVGADADEHIADMDVIVTATSGAGKKVLDIMKVKPGAVITDVARPLDLSAEDVAKRPDVLVIESGEIELPGDPQMKGIGLPKGVAYACLAETIVLALEGRYETFTVGRNIEWEKVKEIYRLGLKHGMKLAAISGVNGVYTDSDLARIRELALAKREESRP